MRPVRPLPALQCTTARLFSSWSRNSFYRRTGNAHEHQRATQPTRARQTRVSHVSSWRRFETIPGAYTRQPDTDKSNVPHRCRSVRSARTAVRCGRRTDTSPLMQQERAKQRTSSSQLRSRCNNGTLAVYRGQARTSVIELDRVVSSLRAATSSSRTRTSKSIIIVIVIVVVPTSMSLESKRRVNWRSQRRTGYRS